MRYILDDNGYVESVSCTEIECNNKGCTAYTGNVPDGYSSIEEWATKANIKAYKVVNGQLVYDSAKDAELQAFYANQESLYNSRTSKSMIMVSINSDKTISGVSAWGWYHLPYNKVSRKVGDKFSLSSDGRVIYTGNRPLKVKIQLMRSDSTTVGRVYPFFNSIYELQNSATSSVPVVLLDDIIIGAYDIKVFVSPSTSGNIVLTGSPTHNYNYLMVEEM